MDREKLRRIIEETVNEVFARAIIKEVFRRYNARPITATALFTGALLDIRFVMDALRNLQGNGFNISAVLSRSAGRIIGVDEVKDVLQSDKVYLEDQAGSDVWATSELILVPTLTVNTAAKVAHCISDTVIADAISKSLMMGKLVIATVEGCCANSKQRMEKYAGKIPAAYAGALSRNLQTIKEYGVVLTSARNFEQKVCLTAFEKLRSLGQAVAEDAPRPALYTESAARKKIIGLADLMNTPSGGRITVGKDAIVTQLAGDHAARYGISIVRSN